jgi:hypothetical protein
MNSTFHSDNGPNLRLWNQQIIDIWLIQRRFVRLTSKNLQRFVINYYGAVAGIVFP